MGAAQLPQFDVVAIARRVDCRDLVAQDLGAGRRRGDRVFYRCPFHKDDTPSFVVRAGDWRCFGCQAHGDAIGWMMQYRKMAFVEACEALGGERATMAGPVTHARPAHPPPEPPAQDWQAAGMAVVEEAEAVLWSDRGEKARRYLTEQRGLGEGILRQARIGYVPGEPDEWRQMQGMAIPCGIVIPWIIERQLWMLKVRRAAGKPKYVQPAGGKTGGLYWIDQARAGEPVMIVEGEFDALTVHESWLCSAVALGSANIALHPRWYDRLVLAPALLARMDDDEAGQKAAAGLRAVSRRIRLVQVPAPHKDINEMAVADRRALVAWLCEVLDDGG